VSRQASPTDAGHREDWEQLGRTDPLWAVLSDPAKRGRRWDTDEFFATGEDEAVRLMRIADRLGHPVERRTALDFGAGVGRVSRALASRFESVLGLDVSTSMVDQARGHCADHANVTFVVADGSTLAGLPAGGFDLVYSRWVLQHLPSTDHLRETLRSLARVVAPGGLLAVQMPGPIPLRHRLQPRRRAYALLRRVGIPSSVLLGRLALSPIRMTGLGLRDAREILRASGLVVLEVHADVIGGSSIDSFTFYATTASSVGGAPAAESTG
jgi:SAM-dependent methyltransferase